MIRASLYLDEDVNLIIADMLTSQGFKAVCVQEVGRKGLPDSDQFRYAVENGMVMVTHTTGGTTKFSRLSILTTDSTMRA